MNRYAVRGFSMPVFHEMPRANIGAIDNDSLLTADDLRSITRMSTATLYRRIASGELPRPMKWGRSSRWSRREVMALIAAKREAAA